MSSYCRSSWRSASRATPETVPVNSPVAAKKTGLFLASANTGTAVSVNVRVPDAFLKRPVPPVTSRVRVQWASRAARSMQSLPCVRRTYNRLPSSKRNTPAPARSWKVELFGPEQVLDDVG